MTNSLHLEPNKQYFLSGAYSASARLRLREYSSGGSNLSEYFDSGSGISFTTKSNVSYVNVQIVFYAQNSVKFYPMVTEGSTALPYEPYGNNWYIEKNIGKVVLDGSESWQYNSGNNVFVLANFVNYLTTGFIPLSNYYNGQVLNQYSELANYTIGFLKGTNNRLVLKNTDISNVSNLQTWLSSNNTTVYYVLSTPEYETITNENLLQQLNNIQDIELIENLCYVDWVGVEKPKMKLFCYLDKDKIIEEITG